MRHIQKNTSPVAFEKWKVKFKHKHNRPATYNDLDAEKELKASLKEALISGGLSFIKRALIT